MIIRLPIIFLSCVLCLVLTAAGFATTADTVKVVATVNGEAITVPMVERELVRIHSAQAAETSRTNFSLDKLVQRLINDRLLEQEARNISLDQDSAVAEKVTKFRDNLAYQAMMKSLFPDTFSASDAEIRAKFANDFQRFEIRTLCVMDSALARSLADSIRNGVSMAALTKAHSIDKFKDQGGLAGTYALLQLPQEIQTEALTAKPGTLLGPDYLWKTYALIEIEKRLDPDTAIKLDSVRTEIERRIKSAKHDTAMAEYARRLRTTIPVVVDSTALDSIPAKIAQNSPFSDHAIVTVGETHALSETDLRTNYMYRVAGNPTRDVKRVLLEVLNDQTQSLLLQAEAAKSRYRELAEVKESAKAFEDSALVIAYLEDVIGTSQTVSDSEMAAFYAQNKSLYHDAGKYKVLTLTRMSEQEANDDYQALLTGTEFSWLAKKHSVDEVRDLGGERDWLTADKLPVDGSTLDTMKIGAIAKPVVTDHGVVIVKLVDRQAGAPMSLERVKGSIEASIRRRKQLEAIDATIQKLRKSAEITVNEEVIKELRVVGKRSGGQN